MARVNGANVLGLLAGQECMELSGDPVDLAVILILKRAAFECGARVGTPGVWLSRHDGVHRKNLPVRGWS
jgi:hypothetical protein